MVVSKHRRIIKCETDCSCILAFWLSVVAVSTRQVLGRSSHVPAFDELRSAVPVLAKALDDVAKRVQNTVWYVFAELPRTGTSTFYMDHFR